VSLPAADDLFRPTSPASAQPPAPAAGDAPATPAPAPTERKPSGRVRHDEKMTVYVTSDELLEIEHARLRLRRDHDLAVDRGRLVREAIAMVLADFEGRGEQSALVRRLSDG
jgi:hypothetical protein